MLAVFGPIWILTALGYAVRRWRLLNENGAAVLGTFVFHLAMPAALFLTLANKPVRELADRSLVAFAASTVLVIGAGWLIAGRWFGRTSGERAMWGMSAGYVNSANLGIPIAMQVLGNVSFLVEVVLLQVLVVAPIILVTLDRQGTTGRIRLRRIATLPLRNPVILGSALGVVASATGFEPPPVLRAALTLLAAAAVPTALIALGAALYHDQPATRKSYVELAAMTALKLVVQPTIAYAVGVFALHLTRSQLLAVVVCAGLPTAQNTFIFAQEYGVGVSLAGRAVLVTTTLSLATLAAAAYLLAR